MARPSKSAKVLHECSQTKAELAKRIEIEEALQGNFEKVKPSARLNSNQKKIFNYIVTELQNAKIIGNLDAYMLESACIAIDRLQSIEKEINRDFNNIYNRELMNAKSKYSADFFKVVNELCLSPQARAKMGILALNQEQEKADPLLKVLKKVN